MTAADFFTIVFGIGFIVSFCAALNKHSKIAHFKDAAEFHGKRADTFLQASKELEKEYSDYRYQMERPKEPEFETKELSTRVVIQDHAWNNPEPVIRKEIEHLILNDLADQMKSYIEIEGPIFKPFLPPYVEGRLTIVKGDHSNV